MIKKFIPEKYDISSVDIFKIIQDVAGNVPITLRGRVIEIDATLTTQQKITIRDTFLSQVEEVQDLTL